MRIQKFVFLFAFVVFILSFSGSAFASSVVSQNIYDGGYAGNDGNSRIIQSLGNGLTGPIGSVIYAVSAPTNVSFASYVDENPIISWYPSGSYCGSDVDSCYGDYSINRIDRVFPISTNCSPSVVDRVTGLPNDTIFLCTATYPAATFNQGYYYTIMFLENSYGTLLGSLADTFTNGHPMAFYGTTGSLGDVAFNIDTGTTPSFPTPATCSDGIQNQDETGVDTGGVCKVSSYEKSITAFGFNSLTPNVAGTIDETNHTVTLTVPFGTNVAGLVPTITISDKATISPGNNIAQDFTNPVTYTVTAEDKSTQTYMVTVIPSCTTDCFSNVLFIPGLEASRLYTLRGGDSEDQLWEPNGNSDVEDLYLNSDGTSKNQNIYTRDIIKESNTLISSGSAGQNIYKSFANAMDQLVNNFKIADWKYYAYDWRQSVDDIVTNGTKYQNGTVSLTDTLQSLIKSSKNGKVTIIAHSNGGLIAKALLKKLQDDKIAGRNNLIDSVDTFIMVAVPEIGTASALPAIMHGYDQSMAGGWLMDQTHARELGRNMQGAFGLLPSREYINRVSASPVTFVDTLIPSNVTTKLVQTFGSAINSYSEYKDFLFGTEGRIDPAINQMNLPISLSQSLFAKAETLHDGIDAWIPPSSLRVIEVAGWGLDTVASYEYYPQVCTQSLGCGYTLDERPRFTSDGDGTVVVPSAQYMSAEKYWVDLPTHNKQLALGLRRNREHKDILEVASLESLINSVITKADVVFDNVLKNSQPTDNSNRLRLSIHSPVTLDAYNADGEHTGKICPETSDFCYAEENIPNSSYLEFGEGKYINLPEDEMKSVKLQGTDIGTFTYDSEKILPGGPSTTSSFVDIPVTTQTQAEVTLNQAGIPQLALDVTGDGVIDLTLAPSANFEPITYLQVIKATIDSLDIPQAKIKAFDNRVDTIIKSIQKGKIDKAKLKAEKFKSFLEKKLAKGDPKYPKPKKLSKTDAQLLLDMLNKLLDNLS